MHGNFQIRHFAGPFNLYARLCAPCKPIPVSRRSKNRSQTSPKNDGRTAYAAGPWRGLEQEALVFFRSHRPKLEKQFISADAHNLIEGFQAGKEEDLYGLLRFSIISLVNQALQILEIPANYDFGSGVTFFIA